MGIKKCVVGGAQEVMQPQGRLSQTAFPPAPESSEGAGDGGAPAPRPRDMPLPGATAAVPVPVPTVSLPRASGAASDAATTAAARGSAERLTSFPLPSLSSSPQSPATQPLPLGTPPTPPLAGFGEAAWSYLPPVAAAPAPAADACAAASASRADATGCGSATPEGATIETYESRLCDACLGQ